jgi:hypothetical protein
LDEPTTNESKVNRGFKTSARGATTGSAASAAGAEGLADSNRKASPGSPAAAASRDSRSPWCPSIHSAKTRLGTETVRLEFSGPGSKETWWVGANQVLSSYGSSFSSSRFKIEVQISVMPTPVIRRIFHSCGKLLGGSGGGSIRPRRGCSP